MGKIHIFIIFTVLFVLMYTIIYRMFVNMQSKSNKTTNIVQNMNVFQSSSPTTDDSEKATGSV